MDESAARVHPVNCFVESFLPVYVINSSSILIVPDVVNSLISTLAVMVVATAVVSAFKLSDKLKNYFLSFCVASAVLNL